MGAAVEHKLAPAPTCQSTRPSNGLPVSVIVPSWFALPITRMVFPCTVMSVTVVAPLTRVNDRASIALACVVGSVGCCASSIGPTVQNRKKTAGDISREQMERNICAI